MDFQDRLLKCSDCGNDFIFTAGEQLFFFDRQFKNDPKRCKLCKAKRAGLGRSADGAKDLATLPLSRTETRTECSSCGVETTVPFRPTQGRPVFCRSCFQVKRVTPGMGQVLGTESVLGVTETDGVKRPSATVEAIAGSPMAAINGEPTSHNFDEAHLLA